MRAIIILTIVTILKLTNSQLVFLNEDPVQKCPIFACSTTESDEGGICRKGVGLLTEKRTITTNKCKANNVCQTTTKDQIFSNENFEAKCIASTYPGPIIHYAYPGETATAAIDCKGVKYFDDNDVEILDAVGDFNSTTKKCVGSNKGKKCQSTESCVVGHYCKKNAETDPNGVCVELKVKGEKCDNSYQCKQELFCHGSPTKTCIEAFSLDRGVSIVVDAAEKTATTDFRSFLCKSGSVKDDKCVEEKYSLLSTVGAYGEVKCTFKSKCRYHYYTTGTEMTVLDKDCECGRNDAGQGYCPFAYNDTNVWAKRSGKVQSFKKENLINGLHTMNKTKELSSVKFSRSSACQKVYLTSNLFRPVSCFSINDLCNEISDEESSSTPKSSDQGASSSNSRFIKMTITIISIVFLLMF